MAIRRGDLVQLGWRHRHLNGVGASGVRIRVFVSGLSDSTIPQQGEACGSTLERGTAGSDCWHLPQDLGRNADSAAAHPVADTAQVNALQGACVHLHESMLRSEVADSGELTSITRGR